MENPSKSVLRKVVRFHGINSSWYHGANVFRYKAKNMLSVTQNLWVFKPPKGFAFGNVQAEDIEDEEDDDDENEEIAENEEMEVDNQDGNQPNQAQPVRIP